MRRKLAVTAGGMIDRLVREQFWARCDVGVRFILLIRKALCSTGLLTTEYQAMIRCDTNIEAIRLTGRN